MNVNVTRTAAVERKQASERALARRLLSVLLALVFAAGATHAWCRYLVRAAGFQLWSHPYLPITVVALALAVWMWRRGGVAPAAWQLGICLALALYGLSCWRDQTAMIGRGPRTWFAVAVSTMWISLGMLSVQWRPRLAAMAWIGSLAVGAVVVAGLQLEGLDGQGAAILTFRWPSEGAAEAPIEQVRGVAANDRPEAERFAFPCLRFDGTGTVPPERLGAWRPPELMWSKPVGSGWSGVVVDRRRRAYTLAEVDGQEMASCWDLESGETLWTRLRPCAFARPLSGPGPRSTPVVWPDRVATLGADGQLVCRQQRDGRRLWTRNILQDAGAENTRHGVVASPLWLDGLLVVTAGGKGRAVTAYEAETGAIAWQAGDDQAGYSSPMSMTLGAERQIVVLHRYTVAGYSLQGELRWSHDYRNDDGANAIQPLQVTEQRLLLSSGYGRRAELIDLKSGEPTIVWQNRRPQTKFSSGVARDGHIFALDNGVLCCLDAATGKLQWKAGRYGHGQLLLSGELLIIQTESGEIVFARPSPTGLHEVGQWPALERRTWNSPCLAGPYLILRNDKQAVCYKIGDGEPSDTDSQHHPTRSK